MNFALDTNKLQSSFRALGDPSRRQILVLLSKEEMTIAEVASHFDMTRAAVKKHLIILEEGALISVRVDGRECINRLEPAGLKAVDDWLNYFNRFWDGKLERLRAAIEKEQTGK